MRALLLVVALAGCATASTPTYTPPTTSSGKVGLAVEIAAEITRNPDDATALLDARGMTPDDLETLMADIAADKDMSEAYAKARGK